MVGDGIPDLLAGSRAGCRTIFIGRWKCEICQFTEDANVHPAFVAKDLWEACQFIRLDIRSSSNHCSPVSSIRAPAEFATRPLKLESVTCRSAPGVIKVEGGIKK
jgi:HAD-hyrolase-like protein